VRAGRKPYIDEIERLGLRIEELREAIARSRRLRLVGLASAVIAPALIVGFVLGLVDYSPIRVIVAFALAIGGMVLMGSSRAFPLMSPNSAISLALLRAL
jgi:tetrahydromethanopterin S-methyltransferase subunit F